METKIIFVSLFILFLATGVFIAFFYKNNLISQDKFSLIQPQANLEQEIAIKNFSFSSPDFSLTSSFGQIDINSGRVKLSGGVQTDILT